jgi:DNA-binding winged helix-turn-helix (wHTH) protein/TolB-like protein/Flp pilus assembly protein TadD
MASPIKQLYEFGPFLLDGQERLLLRDGQVVSLTPKSFETLLALVERGGRIATKDELMQKVWPESFVEENTLNQNISALRKILGDAGDGQKYIETVPRRGYRFVASVRVRAETRVHIEERVEKEVPALFSEPEPVDLNRPGPTPRKNRMRLAAVAAFVAVGLAIAAYYFLAANRSPQPAESPIQSIAVLPFQPLSQDADDDYLGLGMADALITRLANTTQITVRPTSAVRRYTSQADDPVLIGRELNVGAVLEGAIQKSGERIRVTVQLVRVSDGKPLWADKFEGPLTDILSVQDSIAERLAARLALQLTGPQKSLLTKRHTNNTEAYTAYLKGRYHWNRRSSEGYKKAIEYFQQAIDKDPNYALAYAGQADCYVFGTALSLSPTETMLKAEAAAAKALAIDGQLAEAHTSQAFVKERFHWDRQAAREAYVRALEIDPGYVTARDWFALHIAQDGRLDEAVAELRRAQELDPLSPVLSADLAWVFVLMGQNDRAIAEGRRSLETDPNFIYGRLMIGVACSQKGLYDEALQESQKAMELSKGLSGVTLMSYAYARSGNRGETERALDRLKELARQGLASAYDVAAVYAARGENDRAFEWLEQAYKTRSAWMAWLKVDPRLENLHSDARFKDLLGRVGFN